jgi:hypothetical protein
MGQENRRPRLSHLPIGTGCRIQRPFVPGAATEKPVRCIRRVPGSPLHAETKYDVAQTFSFVDEAVDLAKKVKRRQERPVDLATAHFPGPGRAKSNADLHPDKQTLAPNSDP